MQLPDIVRSYNRYAYCMNNPLVYVDENGEFWHIIIGALVGGIINLVANWDNVDGFWDGLATFGVGAGSGALIAATGGAGAGFWTVTGVAAGGGALTGATNSIVAQTGANFSGFEQVDWRQVGSSSLIGGAAGFAGGAAGYWAANASILVNNVSNPILRSAVVSPIAAGAGHVAGGTTAGLLQGQSFGEAFANSFEGIGKSMAMGLGIGVTTTIAVSYASGINPFNGKNMYPSNNGFKGQPTSTELQPGQIIDRYGDETGRYFTPEGTPIANRSLPPSANTNPYNTYEVVNPFPVQSGIVAPFYGQPGGGIQYYSPNMNVQQLINQGYIRPVIRY